MENDILDSLEDLGYKGSLLEDGVLLNAVENDDISNNFMTICKWLIDDIQEFTGAIENVSGVDSQEFSIEVSGFLREYGCPYSELSRATGLNTTDNRLLLLNYLTSELQACRILGKSEDSMEIDEKQGSPAYCHLNAISTILGLPELNDNTSVFDLLSDIEKKVNDFIRKCPKGYLGEPLLTKRLSPAQWAHVNKINNTLTREYSLRRQTLLTRLDVTVRSFRWSELGKQKQDSISGDFQPIRSLLEVQAPVTISDVLAARNDLTKVVKTNSETIREKTKCAINRVLIGKVPSRGGKPSAKGPPPDMPQFSKREAPKDQRPKSGRGEYQGGHGGNQGGYQGGYSGERGGRSGRGGRVQRGHGGGARGGGSGKGWGDKSPGSYNQNNLFSNVGSGYSQRENYRS